MGMHQGRRGVAFERQLPDQKAINDNAKRINVRPVINGRPLGLFGRHILRRAHNGAGLREGGPFRGAHQAKVHQGDMTILCDHDVGRFDVAVNDPTLVGVIEGVRDLMNNAVDLVQT